jgi:hypothetical protein
MSATTEETKTMTMTVEKEEAWLPSEAMTAEEKEAWLAIRKATAKEKKTWLAIRRVEGLRIDPATAEVVRQYGFDDDPYALGERYREDGEDFNFARSPGSDISVWFGDLPQAIEDALWKRLYGQDPQLVFDHLRAHAVPGCFCFRAWCNTSAVIFGGLGSVEGIPDLILIRGGKTYGLELKTTGRLSDAQKATHEAMRRAGVIVATAFGLNAAISQLQEWGCCPTDVPRPYDSSTFDQADIPSDGQPHLLADAT